MGFFKRHKNKVTVSTVDPEDGGDRGHWGSPVEFILSCLGYAVGLGNVWRFPYMCYTNGGGAFLIPYAIMLTFVGLPVFLIELSVGQYSASGPMTVWEASPIFQGVGAGMVIISFIGSIYYNMIIGWALYYMFASFQKVLPWQGCDHDYNTPVCYSRKEAVAADCADRGDVWYNLTCIYKNAELALMDTFNVTCQNTTAGEMCTNVTVNPTREMWANVTKGQVSSSEEYFNNRMLGRSDRIEDTNGLNWELCLVLLLAWIMCFLCIIKGIKSSGKVVYFTATFPYLLLVILFFRGVTLEGAGEGIKFYLIPEWDKLLKPKVWADAAGQIFFSLSVGMGGLMTFSSYNKFHNNVYRDTLIVTIGNCLTSFFAGFVIFSILGFMAHTLDKEVSEVASSGSGLAFIAYPEVVTYLPVSQLWAVLFFFMLITLGLDSQFAGLENIQTAICDCFPQLRPKKTFVALILSIIMFLLGLTMCTDAGVYWLDLMGYYSSGWSLVLMGLAEGIVFPWVYGAERLINDIEHMVGFRIGKHWWFCWKFITPLLLIAVLIVNIIDFTPLSFGDYVLPGWAQFLGWCMALVSIVVIPIFAVYHIWASYKDPNYDGLSLPRRIIKLSKPTENWLPAIEKGGKNNGAVMKPIEVPPSYTPGVDSYPHIDTISNGKQPAGPDAYQNPAYSGSLHDVTRDSTIL